MDVVFTLSTLFFDHDQVIVSGLGVFTTEIEKAYIHPVENSFTPEFKKIKFRADANVQDDFLAKKLGIASGKNDIDEFVAKIQKGLKAGQKVQLKNIGYLYVHHTGEIILDQDRSFNYVKKNFGLQGFIQDPVKKIVPSEEPIVAVVPEKKKSKSRLLIVLWVVAIILAGIAYWQVENISSLFKGDTDMVVQTLDSTVTEQTESQTPVSQDVIDTAKNRSSEIIDSVELVENSDNVKPSKDSVPEVEASITQAPKEPVEKEEVSNSIPENYKGPNYYVIAGCFESKLKAEDLLAQLHEQGYEKAFLKGKIGRLHRVCYDVFAKRSDASNYMLKLKREGRKGVWIQKKSR